MLGVYRLFIHRDMNFNIIILVYIISMAKQNVIFL